MTAKKIYTIKRTHHRRFPLLLQAEHEDRGPYYLVDRAGFGVSWRKPVYGRGLTRTWIPVFERARLAFTLVDEDDDLSPQEAKRVADLAWKHIGGQNPSPVQLEHYAIRLLERRTRS